LDRRLDGPQSRSGRGGEEKNSQPLPGLEPPIIQPVAQRYTAELSHSIFFKLVEVKVKLTLWLTKRHAVKAYWGVEVQGNAFFTSALGGDEWSVSRPGRFIYDNLKYYVDLRIGVTE
jgi:hypothetical protein